MADISVNLPPNLPFDIAAVEEKYNFKISGVTNLAEKRKIYRLQTDKGNLVLKPVTYPSAEFEFIKDACNYLAAQGCRTAAVIPGVRGDFCFETAENGNFFIMNYLKGRSADFRDEEHIAAVAAALADLHRRSFGFHSAAFADRVKIGRFAAEAFAKIQSMQRWQMQLQKKAELCYFDYLYSGYAAKHINLGFAVLESLQKYYGGVSEKYRRKGCICHHDLANHNILLDKAGEDLQVGFVDFDYCIADVFVHDLASVLLRVGKANHYNSRLALSFWRQYEKQMPMGAEEKLLLWDYLRFPVDFWQMGLAFYEEIPAMQDVRGQKIRRGRLDRRLTEYMDNEEKKHIFLRELRSEILGSGIL